MFLSPLQKYILNECYREREKKVNRKKFADFYGTSPVKKNLRVKIITKSLERLIERGLLVGYGMRTPKKWFISEARLTALGKKEWEKWLQPSLLKNSKVH